MEIAISYGKNFHEPSSFAYFDNSFLKSDFP